MEILAEMFAVSKTTANDIFWRLIDVIYEELKLLIKWQDRDPSMQTLPHLSSNISQN